MFLGKFKLLPGLMLFVFMFVYFGATACLAVKCHICCPEQSSNCPIINLQETPRSVQTGIVVLPVVAQSIIIPSIVADSDFQKIFAFEFINISPPYDFLLAKIGHLTNAPPIA